MFNGFASFAISDGKPTADRYSLCSSDGLGLEFALVGAGDGSSGEPLRALRPLGRFLVRGPFCGLCTTTATLPVRPARAHRLERENHIPCQSMTRQKLIKHLLQWL